MGPGSTGKLKPDTVITAGERAVPATAGAENGIFVCVVTVIVGVIVAGATVRKTGLMDSSSSSCDMSSVGVKAMESSSR